MHDFRRNADRLHRAVELFHLGILTRSIGSNDLTQLVLGVDRDSDRLAELFDDRHEAVKRTIASLIESILFLLTRNISALRTSNCMGMVTIGPVYSL